MDFHIIINPSTANPGYWQMCVGYILARRASPPYHNEVTMEPMLHNRANDSLKRWLWFLEIYMC